MAAPGSFVKEFKQVGITEAVQVHGSVQWEIPVQEQPFPSATATTATRDVEPGGLFGNNF